ncbi:uncharacterized protein TNCV_4227971 [Trichonephila clavipes]|nr:uncharacterized protein TNCV_4227971 [Trichonephila clavipes]
MQPSWFHKLKRNSSEKTFCCQSAHQALCLRAHCRRSRRWGIIARSSRCSKYRRIVVANINTPAAVDQRAANYLEKAVWSFTAMLTRCLSSRTDVTFLRPLPVFLFVQFSSVYCFQTRITVERAAIM